MPHERAGAPPRLSVRPVEPLAGAFAAFAAERPAEAAAELAQVAARYPVLEDYALYFQARAARRAGRRDEALEKASHLLQADPDSVWKGPAALLAGELALERGDLASARGWLASARSTLPESSTGWARATLALARAESPSAALELARTLRQKRGLAARRGSRLEERLRSAHPDLPPPDPIEQAEQSLREGDGEGAQAAVAVALAGELSPPAHARALWARARAERMLGDRTAAEATCLALAREHPDEALAPRALTSAAGWRWNADDDEAAARLYEEVVQRFPESGQAVEALYAVGRIAQESGRYDAANAAYTRLTHRYPEAPLAAEAAWRAGWVRYLAAEFVPAERSFRELSARAAEARRAEAEYWGARALAKLGRAVEARQKLAAVAERHPMSYYAGLAEERLGRPVPSGEAPASPEAPSFPAELSGAHAERARLLAQLGFFGFARRELQAHERTGGADPALLAAYSAVHAPGAAIRLARAIVDTDTPGPLTRYLYPLGYWTTIRAVAEQRGVDPLLVAALIRQESLFEPDAVSPANARGLMQLMPSTARQLRRAAGRPPLSRTALHEPATNIELGVTLLARLLSQYDGSREKALAAYNAGEDAVAKWEVRYGDREADEFVELISFRETRDYVKTVLRNHRLYRQLYAASASATSLGNPPKAPFDMMTMTSPGRADATR